MYEGKPTAGMTDLVARGEIARGATILHAPLGGLHALDGYSTLFAEA